ncbi:MAG: RNase adapter RapZ [Oligoflexales bacterium]|nr:RNase adapter RapZ [Oligoflexales bacterium]
MSDSKPLLVIITGLSGAGKSIAIKALEDLSFACIDNLPIELLDHAVKFFAESGGNGRKFALGLDMRDPDSVKKFAEVRDKLSEKIRVDVVFLTCEEEIVIRRYSMTRRKHPLLDQGGELISAIRREAKQLSPIEALADHRIDTSTFTPHYLSRVIESRYSAEVEGRSLHVTFVSFGFKHGILKPADSIFDVRFLVNPFFKEELSEKTGLDPEIQEFIKADANTEIFLEHLVNLHKFLLPNYHMEGKHYFRIGIGCTGGRHRSVFIAEELAHRIAAEKIKNVLVSVSHRDLNC